jgi:RecJ-like exonuclease
MKEYKLLKEISRDDLGSEIKFRGEVNKIKQTTGPTLMVINDGTANFTLKAFVKPGIRAYPEIDIGDYVSVKAVINERGNDIEGEVKDMKKLSKEEVSEFKGGIDKLNEAKIEPETTTFSINSEGLESLKPRFIEMSKIIKKAIVDGRPIILRHNADTDGYSSAITLERAIIKFMLEITGGDNLYVLQNYRRAPSKAPFYEYEDAVKDLFSWLKDNKRNNAKPPLIIITDNGSTEEDILSIKQMMIYDADLVVVDHHYPGEVKDGKVEVDKYVKCHINPYLTGFDSNICAGMLGYELARFIYLNNENSVFIPAMAAILDHTEGPERDQYLELAKKEGFSEEYLANLGEIIDMQSHYLRFMEAREFVDDLFGANMDAQKKIVEMLTPELEKRYDAVWKVAKEFSEKKDFDSFYLIKFNGELGTFRGDYPAIGKSTNYIHKMFEKELNKPIITMTYGSTFMTIRVSDKVKNFSVPEFVQLVFEKEPNVNANGGGHEHAGSVRFVEYGQKKILDLFDDYLTKISKNQ